ncbi:uncharacterized protein FIBRA_00766 [Fibroporia radiculosa]|uniref:Phosphodiesterase n=1 Tax=Fibroporia radiculosa TaxID=599839 RepID=J4I843_9APHY|nr:uncharacterized protein FIBRA_00766 [Fibroporia radiculosa]CCL98761.1 predicted protein [Fibroporia radiculosa]
MDDAVFGRRRSVDVGGLALALSEEGSGHGWGGWEQTEYGGTRYAEVLIDVRAHTETIVHQESVQSPPFTALDQTTRHRLVLSLSSWNFEPHKLPEEEIVACSYILFEALFRIQGMEDAVGVPLARLASFLSHLRQVYRQGNSYHNFQHALDVFQATYHFLYCAGMVPPVSILLHADARSWERDKLNPSDRLLSCLTAEDLFALSIAAVGHDVGHPGLTNAFMKNAKTPLAVVYDDKSVLEQMHYSLILQLMRHNGLGSLLDRPNSGPLFRKLLLGTVLATDLSLHQEFMTNFADLVAGGEVGEHKRKVLLCQALIKCADISNPVSALSFHPTPFRSSRLPSQCRPYGVSKHWVTALESEWSCQLLLERHLHLPATVKPSDDALGEARGQVWFISMFARPLFELVAKGITGEHGKPMAHSDCVSLSFSCLAELEQFARQCRDNLATWETRTAELSAHAGPAGSAASPPFTFHPGVASFLSAFPPTLPESFRSSEDSLTHRSASDSHSSGSSVSSHYETCESGPPSPFAFSSVHQPVSPTSRSPNIEMISPTSPPRPPSSSSVSSYSTQAHDATAAIRAAYKVSVRKKKSWHRSSWNPGPGGFQSIPPQATIRTDGPSPISPESQFADGSPLTTNSSPMTTHSLSPLTPPDTVISHPRPSLLNSPCDSAS